MAKIPGKFGRAVDRAAIKALEKSEEKKAKKEDSKDSVARGARDHMMRHTGTMSGRQAAKIIREANKRGV